MFPSADSVYSLVVDTSYQNSLVSVLIIEWYPMSRQNIPETSARRVWAAVGAILLGVIAYISWQFVGTLIIGLFFYYASRPLYHWFKAVFRNSTLSAILAMSLVTLPSVITVLYAASIAYGEANRAVNEHDAETLGPFLEPVLDFVPVESAEAIMQGIRSPYEAVVHGFSPEQIPFLFDTALESLAVLGTLAFHLFVALIFAFYVLRDGSRFREFMLNSCELHGSVTEDYLRAVDNSFHKVFFGNIMNSVITGILAALAFNGFNMIAPLGLAVPYPTLLGIISGITSLIPFIGMKLVYFPLTGYLVTLIWIFNAWGEIWFPIVLFALTWIFVDAIPDLFLRPYFSGGAIHMGALMLSYIFGPIFFGWYGLFLGPMILVCGYQFIRIVVPTLVGHRNHTLQDYQ